jgi:hypothetical protein
LCFQDLEGPNMLETRVVNFLVLFPYFKRIRKENICKLHAVCLCIHPNFFEWLNRSL